jgi:isoleucyl-tRNA synthetase
MSKRLKNYPAPEELVDRFGSDALRIALLSSPIVRGVDIRFAEADVRDMVRRFLIPLWNSYYFFTVYANIDEYRPDGPPKPAMPLDYHILAVLQEFKRSVAETTERYDIVKAYELIEQFIDVLNNWYIRLCRQRFWASGMSDDKQAAYSVLHHVLVQLCKVTAPFIPFLAETIFRGLTRSDSVHLEDWPAVDEAFVDKAIIEEMGAVRRVIELGRSIRERNRVRIRQPLQTIGVVGVDEQQLAKHADLIQVQLNVKEIRFHETKGEVAKPAFRAVANVMGPRHGKDTSSIIQRMKAGEGELKEDGRLQVGPHVLDKDEFIVTLRAAEENHDCESDKELVVALNLTVTDELRLEGLARDINRALQSLRKEAELAYDQRIVVGYEANDEVAKAFQAHSEWLAEQGLVVEWQEGLIAGAPNAVFKAEGSGEIQLSLRAL